MMASKASTRRSVVRLLLVVSLVANIGLFYWAFMLGRQVDSLVAENVRLAEDVAGARRQNEILQDQLSYYKAQADYYSRLVLTGPTQAGLVGRSSVGIVAVQQVETGPLTVSYRGVVMTALVELRKGQGRLLINTQPRVGIDLQTSGRTAALVAQNLTGVSLATTDIVLTVVAESSVDVVDGPSAGAAITVAVIAAIRNQTLRRDVFISGTVNPDLTVGSVGGLDYKALAAAEKGASIFLVPKGQSVITVYKPVERELFPGFSIITYQAVRVSLEAFLKDRGYRVTVTEISTVQEAYLIFTR